MLMFMFFLSNGSLATGCKCFGEGAAGEVFGNFRGWERQGLALGAGYGIVGLGVSRVEGLGLNFGVIFGKAERGEYASFLDFKDVKGLHLGLIWGQNWKCCS